jgi:hypothetical protein
MEEVKLRREERVKENEERHVTKQEVKEIARQRDFVEAKKDYDAKLSEANLMLVIFLGM